MVSKIEQYAINQVKARRLAMGLSCFSSRSKSIVWFYRRCWSRKT